MGGGQSSPMPNIPQTQTCFLVTALGIRKVFSSCRDVISSARKVAGKWSLSGWEVASFGREVVLSGLEVVRIW